MSWRDQSLIFVVPKIQMNESDCTTVQLVEAGGSCCRHWCLCTKFEVGIWRNSDDVADYFWREPGAVTNLKRILETEIWRLQLEECTWPFWIIRPVHVWFQKSRTCSFTIMCIYIWIIRSRFNRGISNARYHQSVDFIIIILPWHPARSTSSMIVGIHLKETLHKHKHYSNQQTKHKSGACNGVQSLVNLNMVRNTNGVWKRVGYFKPHRCIKCGTVDICVETVPLFMIQSSFPLWHL